MNYLCIDINATASIYICYPGRKNSYISSPSKSAPILDITDSGNYSDLTSFTLIT